MAIELHFLHGFLGQKEDWNEVIGLLPSEFICHSHDLLSELINHRAGQGLEPWVRSLQADLINCENKKVLVGYSLGGRLLLRLDPKSYDALLLLGSHPGLDNGREQRLQADLLWVERAQSMPQQKWFDLWNQQPIFKFDRVRPKRKMSDKDFQAWIGWMMEFSLAKQNNFTHEPSLLTQKIWWACGSRDEKFMKLKDNMVSWLGKSQVSEITEAGHGVIFEKPQLVAKKIIEVVEYVR